MVESFEKFVVEGYYQNVDLRSQFWFVLKKLIIGIISHSLK